MYIVLQLSGLSGGSVQAMLVDFGRTIDCHFKTDVFAAVHVEVPSFAHHCVLYGADERSAAAVANMLKQYDSSVALVARVRYQTSSSKYCVELVDTRNGRDIKISDLLRVATSAEVPPPADVQPASVEYVYVTCVMADGEFFGQLAKYDSDSLGQFRTRLNEFYSVNNVATLSGPRAGDFCCCLYEVDSLYYRARIVRKFAANKYVVCICDTSVNPLECKRNYSATSNNMKLVQYTGR